MKQRGKKSEEREKEKKGKPLRMVV